MKDEDEKRKKQPVSEEKLIADPPKVPKSKKAPKKSLMDSMKEIDATQSEDPTDNTAESGDTEPPQVEKQRPKSIIETMREVDAKEAQAEKARREKQAALLAAKEKKEREEYEKKLAQDKIELIRLKQGVITESETIHEEKEEKIKLSFWKKISNFFYHAKWWLWIAVFLVGIAAFLVYDYFSREKADLIVMLLTDDDQLQNNTEALELYLEQFVDDEDGNGKIHVTIYPIPVNDSIGEMDYYTGNMTKLSTEMQLADSVLILTDAKANEIILGDETLDNLEEMYPDNENVRGVGYYVRHTDFATKIGYEGKVDRDLCFSLRTPIKTYDSLEEMEENHDIAQKVLERIMEDLDGTEEPK